MVGPVFAGTLFSWSLSNNLGFPFDENFIFGVLVILALLTLFMSWYLPLSIDHRLPEPPQVE